MKSTTIIDQLKAWLRRPQVWGFFVSVAVMAAISLAFFAPDNFDGNTLQQADTQQGLANGHEAQAYEEATGEKALWTGSLFSGMPTFQISPTYASTALFQWLNGLYGLWLPAPSNLLFMMMMGFLIMLYCMRVRWQIALVGAVAWGFSSYFTILIGAGHIWKYLALTFIPPTIGGLALCYRGRYIAGAALTALFAMLQLNANHPQMSYYFAFVMAGMAIAYLAADLRRRQGKSWVKASVALLLAGALAVGANLPSLYNTYEYAKETKRAQSELTPLPGPDGASAPAERPTGGLPKADIVNWSYGGDELLTFLIPNAKGGATALPAKGHMEMLGLDRLDGAAQVDEDIRPLLGYFPQYFNDSEGTNGPVYAGAVIFALFLLGCMVVRGPMKWALVVLTVLSALLAMGRNLEWLTDMMIYHFPMYSKFRAVESILVIAEFTMPLLAVLALARLFSKDPGMNGKQWSERLYAAFGIPAAVCLMVMAVPSIMGPALTGAEQGVIAQVMEQSPDAALRLREAVTGLRHGMVRADALRSLVFLALAAAALIAYARRLDNAAQNEKGMRKSAAWTVVIIGALVLADLYPVSKRYVNHDSFVVTDYYMANYYDPFAPDDIDRAIAADTALSVRVMDLPGFASPQRSYHHKMIGGYHAAKLNRYEDLIQRRMAHVLQYGYLPELRSDSIAALYSPEEQELIRELRADYRVLDMLNARYIITGDQQAPVVVNTSALGNAWLVDTITYVDGADAEMAALATLEPGHEAVADSRFREALGEAIRTAEQDTIRLTAYTPNRLTYHANTRGGGLAVFSEVWFPWGWKAEIDGKPAPLGRADYVLRALRLPAGSVTVTLTFDPDSIHTTVSVAYACVTLIYLLVILALFVEYLRSRKPADGDGMAG